jgi:hypothetical protein
MKKFVLALLILMSVMPAYPAAKAAKFEYYPLNIKVPELLKNPSLSSEAAFVFPIDVTLTGISKDKKWYRFKVSYDLVFLGKYQFEGWCQVDPWKPFLTNAAPTVIELK